MSKPPQLQEAEREKLVQNNLGYVRALARQIHRELGGAPDLDELVASGSHGLVEAATRFDPTRGAAFTTFAHYRIRGAIFDGLRRSGWSRRPAQRRLAAADAYMENMLEREQAGPAPGLEETVTSLGNAIDGLATVFLVADSCDSTEGDIPDGETLLASRETAERVRDAVASLPDKERELVEAFYFRGETLLDAGRSMGLSKSWASRLHTRAIKRLSCRLAGTIDHG